MTSETAYMPGSPSLTTGYQYDVLNNRTRITWPDSYFVKYTYDSLNRLFDVHADGNDSSDRIAYYTYDERSRLKCIIYRGNTNCTPGYGSSMQFNWEIDDDLQSLTHHFTNDNDVTFTYGYDGSGKLISESASQPDWLYMPTYARNDNYAPANALNQYTSIDGKAVSHDLNGNRTAHDGLTTPHDSENRLTSAGGATYKYDADGRRVAKASSTLQRVFLHQMTPVIKGVRVASFFWIQSMIRSTDKRSLLFDLDQAIQGFAVDISSDDQRFTALTGVYNNLNREWAEV